MHRGSASGLHELSQRLRQKVQQCSHALPKHCLEFFWNATVTTLHKPPFNIQELEVRTINSDSRKMVEDQGAEKIDLDRLKS